MTYNVQATPSRFSTMMERSQPAPVIAPPPLSVLPHHSIRAKLPVGELCEALSVVDIDELRTKDAMPLRQRYQIRRDLAELTYLPEGYVFTHMSRRITLLTPPDMIAVQREDGTWYRTPRRAEDSSPPPYSKAWYRKYLLVSGLPLWFLRPAHLSMISDNLESQLLGLHNAPTSTLSAPTDYLDQQYPSPPYYITPRVFAQDMYGVELSEVTEKDRLRLARRFPAVNVPGIASRTIVLPSGHVQLQTLDAIDKPEEDLAVLEPEDFEWLPEHEIFSLASYSIEGTDMAVPLANAQATDPRRSLAQTAMDEGAVLNVRPELLDTEAGVWCFLSDEDRLLAESMDYTDLASVVRSRATGYLPSGLGENAGPLVAFYPDKQNLNPAVRPEGDGRWRFLTTGINSAEEIASVVLGGLYGFPDQPTASQVWRLREVFGESEGVEDLTEGVDLLWVPGEEDEEAEGEGPVFDEW